ncbi:MAG: hypothetical protein C0625_03530 [Arcobacter sp.]|nr:MAG: hypothetical protein C0625_03530 [Arcobacter sp.]
MKNNKYNLFTLAFILLANLNVLNAFDIDKELNAFKMIDAFEYALKEWNEPEQTVEVDEAYFNPSPEEVYLQRIEKAKNTYFIKKDNKQIFSYANYAGNIDKENIKITFLDGKSVITKVVEDYDSIYKKKFDKDFDSSKLKYISTNVVYWYPKKRAIFTFKKDELGKEKVIDGFKVKLLSMVENKVSIRIAPDKRLYFDYLYKSNHYEFKAFAQSKEKKYLNTMMMTSSYKKEGLEEFKKTIKEKINARNISDEEAKTMYQEELNKVYDTATIYSDAYQGDIEEFRFVIQADGDWKKVKKEVKLNFHSDKMDWSKYNIEEKADYTMPKFESISEEDVKKDTKLYAYLDHYEKDLYKTNFGIQFPQIANSEIYVFNSMDLQIDNFQLLHDDKVLSTEQTTSSHGRKKQKGFVSYTKDRKIVPNRIKGTYSFLYPLEVEFLEFTPNKPNKKIVFENNNSAAVINLEEFGFDKKLKSTNPLLPFVSRMMWPKNKNGKYLQLADFDWYYKSKSLKKEGEYQEYYPKAQFTGIIDKLYIVKAVDKKIRITIPFDMKIKP